jgi:negative regulator of sigma E activity
MNCENCQELLSEYIDGELNAVESADVQAHLRMCVECAELHLDFSSILSFCDKREVVAEVSEPNLQALWCRIQNEIENEVKPEIAKELEIKKANRTWLEKLWDRTWQLSFTQTVSAVLGIALLSSLLTIVGVRNYSASNEFTADEAMSPTLFERVLGRIGVIETPRETREKRLVEQQTAIDYWNNRVDTRKAQWNSHLREAFDRNLTEIDQVVDEYTRILEENPQDTVSSEMLDSAMNEKMELLKGFSEL